MNVSKLRTKITREVLGQECECDAADVSVIIMHSLGIDKTALLMGEREVSETEITEIESSIKRLINGEPVQYITGECEFMSLPFDVANGVLIPRADTEVLVETILEKIGKNSPASVLDVCCGSGCVGISLGYYMKKINLSLCDILDVALEITRKNAKRLISDRKYDIFKADILSDFPEGEYDCVVSNPPYIRSRDIETLDEKVKCYEPHIALDGGVDGLVFYRRIVEKAAIKSGGYLAFEIGYDQGDAVSEIMINAGFCDVEVVKDIENRARVVIGTKP